MAAFIIKADGFEVIEAARGQAVLPMAAQHKPDVILLDLRLPDIDGYEVLSSLKALSQGEAPYVIVFSAKNRPEDIEMARSLGASEFVEKPFTVDALLFAIRRQAARAALHRSGA